MTSQHDDPAPPTGRPSRVTGGRLAVIVVTGCVAVAALVLLSRADDGETSVAQPSSTTARSDSGAEATPGLDSEDDSRDSSDASDSGSSPVTTGSPSSRSQQPDDERDVDLETSTPTSALNTLPAEPLDPPDDDVSARAIDDLLTETAPAINPTPSGTPGSLPDLRRVATGAVLDELEATRAEFDAMEWTQTGTPSIVDLRIVSPPSDESPTDAVVEVCLDNSDVRILDSSGADVRTEGTPTRSLNIYTLRWTESRWLVAEHTFPDDPNC